MPFTAVAQCCPAWHARGRLSALVKVCTTGRGRRALGRADRKWHASDPSPRIGREFSRPVPLQPSCWVSRPRIPRKSSWRRSAREGLLRHRNAAHHRAGGRPAGDFQGRHQPVQRLGPDIAVVGKHRVLRQCGSADCQPRSTSRARLPKPISPRRIIASRRCSICRTSAERRISSPDRRQTQTHSLASLEILMNRTRIPTKIQQFRQSQETQTQIERNTANPSGGDERNGTHG